MKRLRAIVLFIAYCIIIAFLSLSLSLIKNRWLIYTVGGGPTLDTSILSIMNGKKANASEARTMKGKAINSPISKASDLPPLGRPTPPSVDALISSSLASHPFILSSSDCFVEKSISDDSSSCEFFTTIRCFLNSALVEAASNFITTGDAVKAPAFSIMKSATSIETTSTHLIAKAVMIVVCTVLDLPGTFYY